MLKKNISYLFIHMLLVAVLTAFAPDARAADKTPGAQIHPVISASDAFAFDLYKQFSETEGNIFFSPYSVTAALAMTYEGARGETAAEMQRVLRLPEDAALRRDFFARDLENYNSGSDAKIANAFWAQKDYAFLPAYKDILRQSYKADAFSADFKNAAPAARLKINKWTASRTNNRIKDLFPADSLNSLTRLVLVDAVYFKGKWEKQFDKKLTSDADFHITSTNTITVKMMRRTGEGAKFKYCQTAELQLLELPHSCPVKVGRAYPALDI